MATAERGQSLHDSRRFRFDTTLFERNDDQRTTDDGEELALGQKEVRIRGLAVCLVATRKRLVNQHAIIGERPQETWKQRAMQVMRDDDGVEFLSLEWPRMRLQVRADRGDSGDRRELVKRGRVTVNRHDATAARGEPSAVASLAARNIEHPGAVRNQA